ncbi:MAG: hypothetical protein J7M25_17770 [Deltaproteobacteria bacterium]|nr:hypothetical protein [Deltaproteobacteria bacterium]
MWMLLAVCTVVAGVPAKRTTVPIAQHRAVGRTRRGNPQAAPTRGKLLLQSGCVLRFERGARFVVDRGPSCGVLHVTRGAVVAFVPSGRMLSVCVGRLVEVIRGGVVKVRRNGTMCVVGQGPGPCRVRFRYERPPRLRLAWKMDVASLVPRAQTGRSRLGSDSSGVTGAASGSMCLDTSGSSGAASSVHEGSTGITKPTGTSRVTVHVHIRRR